MDRPVRVRFAPSPTGALHIGGVRTALYNYLWAKKNKGTFIVRIEDTDQTRYVEGAEQYIMQALEWVGITPDESPIHGGKFAPYRQSDRKAQGLYQEYVQKLIDNGKAYYAFDTNQELDALRKAAEANKQTFKYDALSRVNLRNSLTMSKEEAQNLVKSGIDYVVRLKVDANQTIAFDDEIRGHITYNSNDIDDKVLLKGDGMPTYHLANVVDDYLMEISHVIRGEEWLPSTPTHVLLYQAFGWQNSMPKFAHLPLIMRPDGKGKLSKRDGAKFGIPVFPLDFVLPNVQGDDAFIKGFREWGFEPDAVINFLALLGWSTGTNQEFFTMQELIQLFDIQDINKAGARFDFDKAKWFNQQYLMKESDLDLAKKIRPIVENAGHKGLTDNYLAAVAKMLKERVHFLPEFYSEGKYFFDSKLDLKFTELETKVAAHKAQIEELKGQIAPNDLVKQVGNILEQAGADKQKANVLDAKAPDKKAIEEQIKKLSEVAAELEKKLKPNKDALKKIISKWDDARKAAMLNLVEMWLQLPDFQEQAIHDATFAFMEPNGLKAGDVLPVLRLGLSGTMQGASVFEMIQLFGKEETKARMLAFFAFCDAEKTILIG